MSPTAWWVLFLVASAVECTAEVFGWAGVALVSKSTLMPLLGAWALSRLGPQHGALRGGLVVALTGSWVGDVALALAPVSPVDARVLGIPKHDAWFVVGVLGFFVAHLAFIARYRAVDLPERPGPWPSRPWLFLPPVAIGAIAAAVVLPAVAADPVKRFVLVPLSAYAALLLGMNLAALLRLGRVSDRSFWLVAVGAVTFLVSDALIGLSYLVPNSPIPVPGLWIMLTYLAAEALTVRGLVDQALAPRTDGR